MTSFQCAMPINFKRKIPSTAVSPRGNEIEAFGTVEEQHVHLWYLDEGELPAEGHAERRVFNATCYPPTSLRTKSGDRIELPGEGWFKVVKVADYDNNPYFVPGIVDVKLRRVDG